MQSSKSGEMMVSKDETKDDGAFFAAHPRKSYRVII